MAERHEIEIEITPEGEVKLTVKGVSGQSCVDLTKGIEEALGIVVDRQKTSEYYQDEAVVEDTVKVGDE